MEAKKFPHQPERSIGKWAMSMAHILFKIEEVERTMDGLVYYRGTGLRGQPVYTSAPSILNAADAEILEAI